MRVLITALLIGLASSAPAQLLTTEYGSGGFSTGGAVLCGAVVTWDPASVTNVTLSGSNLVATNTGTTSADQGAKVPSASGKTTGKYYYEVTWTTLTGGGDLGVGVGTTASTYTTMGTNGTTGGIVYQGGTIYNGAATGLSTAGFVAGNVAGIAVDFGARLIWFRNGAGNWNGSGTANPATGVGGVAIAAGTMIPFVVFGGAGGVTGNVATANFGASAFSGVVPSGFSSGWCGCSGALDLTMACTLPLVLGLVQ